MSERTKLPAPPPRLRIDITLEDDLHLWSKRFGVSPAEVKQAVLKVGPLPTDVERELHKAE